MHDLLIGNGVFIVFIDIGLQMCLDIGDAVLFDIVLVGIDLGDDGIVHDTALGLTLIDDDIENTGCCDQLVFDFLGIDILAVGENDEVLLSAGDGQNIVLIKTSVVAGVEVAFFINGFIYEI